MKKFSLFICVLLIASLISSCVFMPGVSTPAEDSNVSVDTSDEISEESVPETSDEVSKQVEENPMASMTAKEIVEYAEAKSEEATSFVQDAEQSFVMDFGDGNVTTQSVSFRGKGNALGTDDVMMSYSFTTNDRTGNFYYKNGKGYSNSNNVRMSFDCTEDEFEEYVALVIFETFTEDNYDMFNDYIYERCVVTPKDDGGYEISFSGALPFDLFAEYMGSDGEYIKQDDEIVCDYMVLVSSEGYPVSEEFSCDFVMEYMDQSINVSMKSVYATSNINENVSVVILDTGYTHVGSIDAMYAALSHEYVKAQDYYKGEVKRKYTVNGYGFNDNVTIDIRMNYDGIEQNKYALTYNYVIDGTSFKYRYYYEDGKLYYKLLNEAADSFEYNLVSDVVFEEWAAYNLDLSYGKDFGYTDNGDGTATFTFTYKDEIATEFADVYVYTIYGEEYYGLFAYADSKQINEAKVTVVVDTETHCFISHSVKIDAKFVIEGETVTFKEESTMTFSPEGVVIPDRASFMGSSSL